jgi:hypothetical protein
MKIKISIVLPLIALIVFASCSDTKLLTKHTWHVDETLVQIANEQTYYKLNGLNTTPFDYSKVRFIFRKDGTGSYTDGSDNVFHFTWAFNANDKTKMTMTIDYGKKIMSFDYSFVKLTDHSFTYTETYTEGGIYVMSQNRYIPFP